MDDITKEARGKEIRRLSLPFNGDHAFYIPNRRHTLVPVRSILKQKLGENNTISLSSDVYLKEKRRVSFAPEVTLHKIDYRKCDENSSSKRKSSNQASGNEKLSTSQYIGKIYDAPNQHEAPNNLETAHENIEPNLTSTQNDFIIDEDTQTMEMSIELTQQILKQQELVKEQHDVQTQDSGNNITIENFRDLFNEVEDNDQSEMEFTETAQTKDLQDDGPRIDNKRFSQNDLPEEMSMELTQPIKELPSDRSGAFSGSTTAIVKQLDSEPEFRREDKVDFHPTKRDLGSLMGHSPSTSESVPTQALQEKTEEFTEMEFTEPIHSDKLQLEPNTHVNEKNDDNQEMEFTQPVDRDTFFLQKESEQQSSSEDKLTTVEEVSEPSTSASTDNFSRVEVENKENMINISSDSSGKMKLQQDIRAIGNGQTEESIVTQLEPQIFHDDSANSSTNDVPDSSELETSLIGTEIVPLAEITGDSTENGAYDSDNSFTDDNHLNVSLDVFLNDVGIQFFDHIGPSESEIQNTLSLLSEIDPTHNPRSPSVADSTSSLSTPSSINTKRTNIIDYIDACSNIPYYHYLVHLVNQYRSSIQSISTMVNTFSNDFLESNPTAIREYYQQAEEVKNDLCTNYQAIAIFTRKQSKCQNLRFVTSLLNQLSISYERSNEQLESDLGVAIDWRKNVLIERQKMIEQKVLLDQIIQKINSLKSNLSISNMNKIKDARKQLVEIEQQHDSTKEKNQKYTSIVEDKEKLIIEKQNIRDQLKLEVAELKEEIYRKQIPSLGDLKKKKRKLESLESSKKVKILGADPIVLLISDVLQVKFIPIASNYKVSVFVYKAERFFPFSSLVDRFINSHEQNIEYMETASFIRTIRRKWISFINLWKEITTIYYLHSGKLDEDKFVFHVSLYVDEFEDCLEFALEGRLDDLLDPETDIKVKLTVQSTTETNYDSHMLLDMFKSSFKNNNVVNRFVS
ncbi:unnamed protein product [Pichia kudriavzevii]